MGQKYFRRGKHLFLFIAPLIAVLLAGCSLPTVTGKEKKVEYPLARANELLARGDYRGALKANQDVLASFPRSNPGDEALFNVGLIYADSANPQKDYKKALESFKRLVRDFPQSQLLEETKVLVGLLEVIEKSKQVDIDIEEKKKELIK